MVLNKRLSCERETQNSLVEEHLDFRSLNGFMPCQNDY